MEMRLNKFLVDAGICSRREADRLIEAGAILVNNQKAVLGQKVTENDAVIANGKLVTGKPERVYIAYHKPIGIICTSDPNATDNIIDAVGYHERLFHIGRLDVASSGLILLTNDGDIVNRILRSEKRVEKEYVVTVHKPLSDESLSRMAHGMYIAGDERKTLPAEVTQLSPTSFRITLIEGRNRQIRRMCEEEGYDVKKLTRVRIMHIMLDELPVGHWRHLTQAEEQTLLRDTA